MEVTGSTVSYKLNHILLSFPLEENSMSSFDVH